MSELEALQRRVARERAARKEAELLLEEKSREVFAANRQLIEMAERTKARVVACALPSRGTKPSAAQHPRRTASRHWQDRDIGFNLIETGETDRG